MRPHLVTKRRFVRNKAFLLGPIVWDKAMSCFISLLFRMLLYIRKMPTKASNVCHIIFVLNNMVILLVRNLPGVWEESENCWQFLVESLHSIFYHNEILTYCISEINCCYCPTTSRCGKKYYCKFWTVRTEDCDDVMLLYAETNQSACCIFTHAQQLGVCKLFILDSVYLSQ